ncbi:hypothetical protein AC1031_016906 [Aphanomyces cochlioides]|nr:hypothetical protein AC1031_016906 [Aphanomyces cochlioides]
MVSHLRVMLIIHALGLSGPSPRLASKKKLKSKPSPLSVWCNESVASLFFLRYRSHLKQSFESKNNHTKKVAFEILAAELSAEMRREFSAKQCQDKFARMKAEWSVSKPTFPAPTGNDELPPQPLHYEIMQEYWGTKLGFQREYLMATDDCSDAEVASVGLESSESEKNISNERVKRMNDTTISNRERKKAKREHVKNEGLIFLGQSIASVQTQQPTPQPQHNEDTLREILQAVQAQATTMAQLLNHLVKGNKDM